MGRHFTQASSNKIDLSLGAGGSLTGAITLAAIINCTSASTSLGPTIICIGSSATTQRKFSVGGSTRPLLFVDGGGSTQSIQTVANDVWQFVAVTKDAGTVTPRFHFHLMTAGPTWIHTAGSGTVGDAAAPTGTSAIGYRPSLNTQFFEGDIAIAGVWSTALTDAQVETLAMSLTPWLSYSNKGLWVLDQADTTIKVWDQSGNGANESALTGTSPATTSVPRWCRGAPIISVEQTPMPNLVTTGSLVLTSS